MTNIAARIRLKIKAALLNKQLEQKFQRMNWEVWVEKWGGLAGEDRV